MHDACAFTFPKLLPTLRHLPPLPRSPLTPHPHFPKPLLPKPSLRCLSQQQPSPTTLQTPNLKHQDPKPGVLYLVATPIGNLTDMTFRALHILQSVDIIAAEDTRRSLNLLRAYTNNNIDGGGGKFPKVISYHEHSGEARVDEIVERLRRGMTVAVTCDAGTPGVSDPGDVLVRKCVDEGVDVVAVPGACAAVTAVVTSGIVRGQWMFRGFLPQRGGERRKAVKELRDVKVSVVYYEAPHRLVGLLELLADQEKDCGDQRQVALLRELTKKFEQVLRFDNATMALSHFHMTDSDEPRGEYTVIVGPSSQKNDQFIVDNVDTRKLTEHLVREGVSPSAAARVVSSALSVPRKPLYSLAISLNAKT